MRNKIGFKLIFRLARSCSESAGDALWAHFGSTPLAPDACDLTPDTHQEQSEYSFVCFSLPPSHAEAPEDQDISPTLREGPC